VHVIGERVANGFTLEIHDRGLGMAADALLDANLRLAETPEFELSDTDRLGLFVVSRLAQRQNVRVSLQPSPYGGTTAVVFIPDTLLTDAPDTEGAGFRLDRPNSPRRGEGPGVRSPKLSTAGSPLPGLPASLLDGPVELEAPLAASDLAPFPGALDDEDSERGGLFRPRRRPAGLPGEQHQHARDEFENRPDPTRRAGGPAGPDADEAPVPLPRRRAPKLVSSHGRPVTHTRPGESEPDNRRADAQPETPGGVPPEPTAPTPDTPRDTYRPEAPEGPRERRLTSASVPDLPRRRARAEAPEDATPARRPDPVRDPALEPAADAPAPSAPSGLPRRVRQANLAPQLKEGPDLRADRVADREGPNHSDSPAERDADEVRNRMASLQRGWRRGREENAAGDDASDGTAQGTTSEGDGR
jgi:hypothetical protein